MVVGWPETTRHPPNQKPNHTTNSTFQLGPVAHQQTRGGGGGGTAQCPRHTRHTNAKRKATSMRPSGRLIYEAAAAPIKAKTATGIRLQMSLAKGHGIVWFFNSGRFGFGLDQKRGLGGAAAKPGGIEPPKPKPEIVDSGNSNGFQIPPKGGCRFHPKSGPQTNFKTKSLAPWLAFGCF